MKRETSLKRKVKMSMLLLAIILFTQCQKSNEDQLVTNANETSETTTTVLVSPEVAKTLVLSSATKDAGYAYYLEPKLTISGDSPTNSATSTLKIYENGKLLGAAHSLHRDIRNIGKGKFSHWDTGLYFSSSDNSDPRTNGRKYTYTTGTSGAVVVTPVTQTTPVSLTSNTPIGFASVDGSTTGGKGGKTITISNLSDLKRAAVSPDPLVIQISGSITGLGMIEVKSNKTFIGLNGAILNGTGLSIWGVSNVIVKNLKINKVIGGDCITIKGGSNHVWIDHCELWQDRSHGWDYYDELLEVTDRSDFVTISWNEFHDSNIALLIGSGDQQTTDIGHLRVTLYGNYFKNISERQPCTRFGYMHCFNNYLANGSGYGIGVTMNATVRTDNNYFEGQNIPIYTDFNSKPGMVSGASTNIYKNCGANKISTSASSWVPSYEYKSVLIAAADVPAKVLSEAGPNY
ncbi:pectate lyase family protein [Arcticibacter eurypsychrophilus]|uniref:pectate lyase family protein n=1 Tax=Arcticibacter eurypsychrophilus TaxID=1434752 RepID=UPI00084D07B0|nr:pectate lyase [Arcticibacter eurypsychrophilus]